MNRRGRASRQKRKRKLQSICAKNLHDYKQLMIWMAERGFRNHNNLKPRVFEGTGRGLISKQDIFPGDTIISVPSNLLITPTHVFETHLGSLIKNICPDVTGIEIIAIFLMCERAKGEKSEWFPYINTLPSKYDVPTYFDHKLLEVLPPPLNEEAMQSCRNLERTYIKLCPLFETIRTMFHATKTDFNFELFRWAYATVNTRCVYKKCCEDSECNRNLALAPFLDFLNHNIDIKVEANFNTETNCFEIKSSEYFKKCTQVFINYGSHNNRKLFLEYGFLIPENENDLVTISFEDILSANQNCLYSAIQHNRIDFVSKRHLLIKLGFNLNGPSWNLETVLKILSAENDTNQWKDIIYGCSKSYPTKEENSTKFRRLFKEIMKEKLFEYEKLINLLMTEFFISSNHTQIVHSLLLNEKNILCKASSFI